MTDPGDSIPDFVLADDQGNERRFADLAGPKGLILYAYPRDNTPGCTTEAQDFRDNLPAFEQLGYRIAGISRDSIKSHAKFVDKQSLNFPLLSDPDNLLLEALGAWGEKKMYGRTSMGIIRSTFVFDRDGTLNKAFRRVRAKGHAERVLADLS